MDFSLSEEQQMLATTARDFLSKECPKSLVKRMAADDVGYPVELWRGMAGMGWMALPFPEKYGGIGGSFVDLMILLEEMGRACLPGPFFSTVVLGGLTILDAASDEQKNSILPRITTGDIILTMAFLESDGRYEMGSIRTVAVADGSDYVVDGTKLFVENAHIANNILVPARTEDGSIVLLLVDARSPGISTTLLRTEVGDKQCEVILNKVRVPRANVIGELSQGENYIMRALQRAAIAKCAEIVGGGSAVLEMTAAYAKERVQFDHPIGSLINIQQKFADLAIAVESSTFITRRTAWMLSEGLPCAEQISIAKAFVSEAYRSACAISHQIHGTVGFMVEHDLPLYTTRAKEAEIAFGDAAFHRNIVARELVSKLNSGRPVSMIILE